MFFTMTSGHTFAWGLGQDNLLTPCYDYYGKPDGFFGPINPILKSTYKFLDGLFREVRYIKAECLHILYPYTLHTIVLIHRTSMTTLMLMIYISI